MHLFRDILILLHKCSSGPFKKNHSRVSFIFFRRDLRADCSIWLQLERFADNILKRTRLQRLRVNQGTREWIDNERVGGECGSQLLQKKQQQREYRESAHSWPSGFGEYMIACLKLLGEQASLTPRDVNHSACAWRLISSGFHCVFLFP